MRKMQNGKDERAKERLRERTILEGVSARPTEARRVEENRRCIVFH